MLNTKTVACLGFGKGGQIERVWGTSPGDEMIQGKVLTGSLGDDVPQKLEHFFNFIYEI